jgi:hypothetical protein
MRIQRAGLAVALLGFPMNASSDDYELADIYRDLRTQALSVELHRMLTIFRQGIALTNDPSPLQSMARNLSQR